MADKFQLPELRAGTDPTLPIDQKQLKKWLNQTSGTDVSNKIRQLYQLLKGLNRTLLADKTRFSLLEGLAPLVDDISANLERHYSALEQPLPPPNRKIAFSLGKLLHQYSMGYFRLVNVVAGRSASVVKGDIYAVAHVRAMAITTNRLMVYYRAYLGVPDGVWRDCHGIYQSAKKLSIHLESPVDDDSTQLTQPPQSLGKSTGQSLGQSPAQSIEQCYLTGLLCELADPYRLTAGEVDRLRAYLPSVQKYCLLGSEAEQTRKPGLFVVHFGIDGGPNELGEVVLRDDRDGFILDISALVKKMHQQLTVLGQEEPDEGQWQQHKQRMVLLRCLVVAFGVRPDRLQQRTVSSGELWVLRGLKTVHNQISAYAAEAESLAEIQFGGGSNPSMPSMKAQDKAMDRWELVDESPGGFALLREAGGRARVNIGDLLAIADNPAGPWETVVVKRVRYQGESDLVVGVARLCGDSRAVFVSKNSVDGKSKIPALLSTNSDDTTTRSTLLLPPGEWQSGEWISLNRGEEDPLLLGKISEMTGHFELFEVANDPKID